MPAPAPSVRSRVSIWLVALGLVAAAVAVPATWAQDKLLDTREYTDAVAPLIEEKAVQESVSAALTNTILTQSGFPPALEPVVRKATDQAVATDQFASIWRSTVAISHRKVVDGMRDEGTGLSLEEDGLQVEYSPLVRAIQARLIQAGVPLADRLPTIEGSFTLTDAGPMVTAMELGRALDRFATPLALLALVLLVAGVAVSERPWRRLARVGIALAVLAVAEWVLWFLVLKPILLHGADETSHLAVEALTGGLGSRLVVVALVGLLAAGVGWLVARRTEEPAAA